MKSHKFTDYTYLEIKDLIAAGCLAIVPTGCTEQQGPHLPVDFDTWFAETVALEAAKHALPYHDIWCRVADSGVPGGHADSFTTSIAMYKRPATVRLECIPSSSSREVNWNDPHLDFTKYSDTGVIGDATKASAELGRRLWDEVILTAATIFRDALV